MTMVVWELAQETLALLLRLRYQSPGAVAVADRGKSEEIVQLFSDFQKYLNQV